jgi:hypothetical protein
MPIKRRLAKGRDQLSPGQVLFLEGAPWPAPDEAYQEHAPGARFRESMIHCWLSSPWRSDMPTDGPTAAELWEQFGSQVTAEWISKNPGSRPPAWWRFNAPSVRKDGDDELAYVTRHH